MSLSEFIGKEVKRIDADMHKIAFTALMGANGSEYETYLISCGKYRQLKAERDRWLARRAKNDEAERSNMEPLPEEEEEEDELPPARPTQRPSRPRSWGG